MSIQNLIKTLKTVKSNCSSNPSSIPLELTEIISTTLMTSLTPTSSGSTTTSFISDLNPRLLCSILSNPNLRSSDCFSFFDFLLQNQSLMPFKPDLQAHLTVICRLLKAREYSDARGLLKSVSIDDNRRYPFSIIAAEVEKCCTKSRIKAKLFNLMLSMYSDNGLFDPVSETFIYMKNNGIMIDEKTCTVHLLALKRSDHLHLALDFFFRMLESGLQVSVYSLTVAVDVLCGNGEIGRARALVGKGRIKPNVITFNVMISACAKRWDFQELELVLLLMENEGVGYDTNTYKLLIDGFTSSRQIEKAEKLVMKMHDEGLKVDSHLYNLVIGGYGRTGSLQSACSLFDKMTERSIPQNSDTLWALIDGLCKAGDMELAMEYVNKMQSKGMELGNAIFNALIDGFCNKGMVNEAMQLQVIMERDGYLVDLSVCEKIICMLKKLNWTEEAKMRLNTMVKHGADLNHLSD